jgi:hypothetical protein
MVRSKPAVEALQLRCPLLPKGIISMKQMQELLPDGVGPNG